MSVWSATAWALPAAACSCVAFEGMKAYAGDPQQQIFTGTITASGRDGVLVAVDRWYQGTGEATVRLAGGFGDQGAACEVMPPPVGSRWLYVAFMEKVGAPVSISSCTPQGRLNHGGDPTGFEMEAEAIAVFGAGQAPTPVETPESPLAVTPGPAGPGAMLAIATGMGAAVVLLFGSLVLIARRRSS